MPHGMVVIGVVCIYAVLALVLAYFAFTKGGKAWGWAAVSIIILLPFGDVIVGWLHWQYLCKSQGGHTVVRTASAKGFFDPVSQTGCGILCQLALTDRGLFVEMDVATPLSMTREKGLQRFYLTASPSSQCADYDRVAQRYPLIAQRVPPGQCIARSPIREISARFEVVDGLRQRIPSVVKLERVTSHVRDRRSDEMLAQATSFWYWGGWLFRGLTPNAAVCPPDSYDAERTVRSALRSDPGIK